MDEPFIAAPPFISGPCGLLPNTKVYVSAQVHLEGPPSARGVTVFVRPYPTSPGNLALLTSSLRNRSEAVGKILSAIAKKDVNIVNAISAGVPDKGEVEICLVLDWSNSPIRDRGPATQKELRKYRDYFSIFPVHSARYVELFEQISRDCQPLFVRGYNGMPRLVIEEILDPSGLQFFDYATVKTKSAPPLGQIEKRRNRNTYPVALIPIPRGLEAKLKLCLNVEDLNTLSYTLAADVRSRTLRAFFPEPTTKRSFVHIGCFHTDAPGTYAINLHPLGRADIHVMNNLVRTLGNGETVLEAVLSVPNHLIPAELLTGSKQDSGKAIRPSRALFECIGKLMIEYSAPDDHKLFTKCNLSIGRPLFPVPSGSEGQTSPVKIKDLLDAGAQLGSKYQDSKNLKIPQGSVQPGPEHRSIAERVRELVQARMVTGISVEGIKEELESVGPAIKSTYLTSLLSRETRSGKLKYAAGRYYPT